MSEQKLLKEIMLEFSRRGSRIFRNNVGTGWTGNKIRTFNSPTQVVAEAGDILIKAARPLHAGLGKGTSDLIGWTTTRITPPMVGLDMAVFTACEVKYGRTRATKEQEAFIQTVRDHGGIACIARSVEDLGFDK